MEKMETLVDVSSQPGINSKLGKIIRMISLLAAMAIGASGCDNEDKKKQEIIQDYKEHSNEMARSINRGGDVKHQVSLAQEPVSKTCVAVIAGNKIRVRDGYVLQTAVFPIPCTEDVLKKIKENE